MSEELFEDLKKDDKNYVWHHFATKKEYSEGALPIVRAKGVYFEDASGRRYLDAVSGVTVVNVGHGDTRIIEVMKKQLDDLAYSCLIYSSSVPTIHLAKKLGEITPDGLDKVFFVDSGSEAVETAIKMARQYHYQTSSPNKYKTVSRWISYHGATLGALSATGRTVHRRPFEPLLSRFPHVPPPYCYRCFFGKEYPDCDIECARFLEKIVQLEEPDTISSLIVEPIIGLTGAAIVPPDEYLPMVREICDRYNILLIFDEVITGFGRTGKMFAAEHWNVIPDILLGAKGITSGYAPLGFAIAKSWIWEAFSGEGRSTFAHGHTYGGHALSCSAGLACVDILEKEGLIERSARMGEYLKKRLCSLDHKIIGDIRGKGLLVGVELVKDRESKAMFDEDQMVGPEIAEKVLEKGVKIFGYKSPCPGISSDMLYITPPLVIAEREVDIIIDALNRSIGEVEQNLKTV